MSEVDLEACLSGDKPAWDAFVSWAGRIVFAAVRRTLHGVDTSDIEDAAQDVFVRLVKDDFRLLRTFDPGRAALSTWLTLVARSTAIDYGRRRRPRGVPIEGHDRARDEEEPALDIEIPLHTLTGRQRLVLRMLFDESRSVPEAARILGVDDQTVRSTKHKALMRLRSHMGLTDGGQADARL